MKLRLKNKLREDLNKKIAFLWSAIFSYRKTLFLSKDYKFNEKKSADLFYIDNVSYILQQ